MKKYKIPGGCIMPIQQRRDLPMELLKSVRLRIEEVKRLLQSDPNTVKDIIAKMSEVITCYKQLIKSNQTLSLVYMNHLDAFKDEFKRIQNLDMEPKLAVDSVNDNIYFPIFIEVILKKITDNVCIIEDDLSVM
jgi:hypothetical protein